MFSLYDQTYDDSCDQKRSADHKPDEISYLPRARPKEKAIRAEEINITVNVKVDT